MLSQVLQFYRISYPNSTAQYKTKLKSMTLTKINLNNKADYHLY